MRNFEKAKRVVIKIGTNILSKDDSIDAGQIVTDYDEGKKIKHKKLSKKSD
jgi:hypothetical protein